MQLTQISCETSTELFSAVADPLRIRLACCLLTAPDGACVCELVDAVDESQPNVSRALKLMKSAGLLEERREGRWVYYRLRDQRNPLVSRLRACLDTVCCCDDVEQCLRRFRARLRLRRGGRCVVGMRN
jgi:ArsR family transcriptional regulator, arsenate/arsenite/antimonite-responsive transcriptional repressor